MLCVSSTVSWKTLFWDPSASSGDPCYVTDRTSSQSIFIRAYMNKTDGIQTVKTNCYKKLFQFDYKTSNLFLIRTNNNTNVKY